METAATRGDFDTLLFLRVNGIENRVQEVAHAAYANGHVLMFEWLYETYPSVADLDHFYSYPASVPAFVSPLVLERLVAKAGELLDSEELSESEGV